MTFDRLLIEEVQVVVLGGQNIARSTSSTRSSTSSSSKVQVLKRYHGKVPSYRYYQQGWLASVGEVPFQNYATATRSSEDDWLVAISPLLTMDVIVRLKGFKCVWRFFKLVRSN